MPVRDFLVADVDHLEHHLGAQRGGSADAAVSLQDLIERVPGGLGDMRRPLLSASADATVGTSAQASELVAVSGGGDEAAGTHSSTLYGELEADDDDDGDDDDDDDSVIDATPPETIAPDSADGDETSIMRLDLDVETATTPSWSASGDDPLIVGDELQ